MDIFTPANSRALARLIALVDLEDHRRFIEEAKAAPDLATFQRVNMLEFKPNPFSD